jgi:2-polyprenyl-6-methoxyphenol hydroxylase-like FAD-dependent oxidoreductase
VDGFQTFIRPDRGLAMIPTNDELTLLVMGWPSAEASAFKTDVEANYLATLELVPEVAERVAGATRVERFYGAAVPNFFRTPFGQGWVLIGDAGYTKDPITAQGISDAFHDAERCAAALDDVFTGRRPFTDAMAAFQQERDAERLPIYEFTTQLATLAPPPEEMQHLLAAMHGNQEAMDAFVSVVAGTLSPADFFDEANLGRILAATHAA